MRVFSRFFFYHLPLSLFAAVLSLYYDGGAGSVNFLPAPEFSEQTTTQSDGERSSNSSVPDVAPDVEENRRVWNPTTSAAAR